MTWWTGAALGFDTETDGPIPTEARIITAAMVLVTPGNPPNEMELMVQPEREIPEGAVKVHGITTERAMAEGQLREVAIPMIAATIGELANADIPVVCHNAPYDLTLLDREMRRLGVGRLEIERNVFATLGMVNLFIGADLVTTFPVLDTMVLDKACDRYRRGSRKLIYTAKHYGVPMAEGSAHGAQADTIAALRIAIAIANSGHFADKSLINLNAAQAQWKAEQQRGLRQHFMETGKGDPATVSEWWPLEPVHEVEAVETTVL